MPVTRGRRAGNALESCHIPASELSRAALAFRAFHAAIAVEQLLAIGYVWWCALTCIYVVERQWSALTTGFGNIAQDMPPRHHYRWLRFTHKPGEEARDDRERSSDGGSARNRVDRATAISHAVPEDRRRVASLFSGGVAAVLAHKVTAAPFRYISVVLGVVALVSVILGLFFLEWRFVAALGVGGIEWWIVYPVVLWLAIFGGYMMGDGSNVRSTARQSAGEEISAH